MHLRPRACRLVVSLWPRRNYNIYARIDNFISVYHFSRYRLAKIKNDGRKIARSNNANLSYSRFQLLGLKGIDVQRCVWSRYVIRISFFWLNFFLKFNTFDVKIRENSLGIKEKKWSYEKSDFSFAVTTFDTTFPSMRAIISHFARFSPILYLLKNRYRPSGTLFHFRRWVH